MPALRLLLLGPPDIRQDGQQLPKPPTLKAQSLLAYLALHRQHPQPRERLACLFWGDRPEHKARRSLTTALWHIRRCLSPLNGEPFLLSNVQSVQINPKADLWLDVVEFESLVAHSELSCLQSAVTLYRGDFMDGFYDDWVLNERYRLEALFSAALARLMAGLEESGQHNAALSVALRLLEQDPLREDAHRLAMRAMCLLGRRNAALEQYHRCREVVQEELGAEPMPETVDLYQSILDGRFQGTPAMETLAVGQAVVDATRPQGRNPLDPILQGPLVGREREMAALRAHYEQALAGFGGLGLVSGEAGVGKTRLIEEFAHHLRWQGVRVLWGRCYEFERIVPYQPLSEALQAVLSAAAPEELASFPSWILNELVRLLPELSEKRPGISGGSAAVPLDQEQAHFFEAVTRFLADLAAKAPLALILDDLHWAAESTLQMVHYLARHLAGHAVLMVGTLRPEAVGEHHPLRELQRQLSRENLAWSLEIGGLSSQAVEALIVEMSGSGKAVVPLACRLYEETDGNPFFLIELVKALFEAELIDLEGGVWRGDFDRVSRGELPLPAGVSEAIQGRVVQLAKDARQALQVAAVLGREFDLSLLSAVWKRGDEATLEALDVLLRRGFVDEGSGPLGRDYAFHHHKIQEVVYAGLPVRRRQHMHAQVGKAMEMLYAPDVQEMAGELAFHFGQGRQVNRALTPMTINYLLLAGDQARLAYAHQEAIDFYTRALDLQKEQGEYEPASRTLMKLGLTCQTALDFQRARQAFEDAFALRKREEVMVRPAPLPLAPHPLRLPWYEPMSLDPALAWDTYSGGAVCHLFSGLVKLNPEMDIEPDVAQSWEICEGGRRFIFRLRDDVCWSDGTRLTAHDFEYAWKRVLDPATGSHHTRLLMDIKGAGAWQAGEEHEPDHLGVRALDAVTLEVELEAPTAYFLHQLSHDATFPVPRHAIEKYGPGWATSGNLVANGPFMLAEWRYGQTMHLVRNPKYHLPSTGNVQEVTLLFLPVVGSGELERYEAGDLDVATLRDPPEVDLARRRYSGEYLSFPFLSTLYVGFDVSRPPFDDPQVRHAFILAVDRERLADVHLRGNVFPATGGLLPPGVLGHSPGIGLPYDPEGARQALAEAGYPGGLGFPAVEALAPGLRIDERAEAIQLQAYWHDSLGLEIVWQALELEAWLERLHSDPPHLHMVSWIADYPDPDSFLRTSGFQGRTRWRNDDYDRLVEVARHTAIPADRVKMYHQADRILVEQAPIMPIYYDRGHLLLKPWVRRFPISIMRWFGYWEDAVLEPH